MDYFARQNLIVSKPAAELIKNIKILVVGVGAGGNEVLKNLILMGFGNITILDFDIVEDSNLSRTTLFRKEDIGKSKSLVAAERLKEFALHEKPNIVGLHGNLMTDFGKGLFKGLAAKNEMSVDALVGAFMMIIFGGMYKREIGEANWKESMRLVIKGIVLQLVS